MIEVKSISKKFEDNEVLSDINSRFERGKTNLIIGQSGSGKTVFLKCLLGLYNIDSGEIKYDGRPSSEMNDLDKLNLRRDMGMVFQGSALFDSLNVLGITNNANYCWEIVQNGTTTGGSWVTTSTDSLVEYNITATGYSQGDGEVLTAGFSVGSNQGSTICSFVGA